MKKTLKLTGIILLTFILCIGLYVLAAFALPKISTDKEPGSSGEVTIYILSNGVHTDLVVPVRTEIIDWSKSIKFENTRNKDTTAGLIAFGWGDKGFYLETPTWDDLKFSTAFKAAFALSTSAMHTTFYKKLKEGNDCKSIKLGKNQYARLVAYINQSLDHDGNGNAIYIKTNANYGTNDAFYEATGNYSLFHTCNTWANNGLKSCGQKACLWTPFDKGIFYHYNTTN